LQAQVFVPGPVLLQLAWVSQPPLLVAHESTAAHTVPFPVYPVLQVQVMVAPLRAHFAAEAQPPLFAAQRPLPVQVLPSPAYPVLQVHAFAPGPVPVQVALGSQPPCAMAQESIGEHTVPVPE
jgi:hypothetical protein